jgi:hypothetical protein
MCYFLPYTRVAKCVVEQAQRLSRLLAALHDKQIHLSGGTTLERHGKEFGPLDDHCGRAAHGVQQH